MLRQVKDNNTLRRGSETSCEYSLVDKNGVDFFFGFAAPSVEGDSRAQLFSACENLKNALQTLDFDALVALNVYLRDVGDKQLARAVFDSVWKDELTPATTFIPQTPCDPRYNVVLGALAVNSSNSTERSIPISAYEFGERASVLEFDDLTFGFFGGFAPGEEPIGAYARSFDAFAKMRAGIENAGMLFPQVFRTWLYQGSIVLPEGDTQRYKELNRARSDFFYGTRFYEQRLPQNVPVGAVYPASTGIGADDVDVAMSAFALKTDRDDVVIAPLENPNQTSAFDYSDFYSPKSPKFARAVALAYNDRASVYVSGTASIVDQKTVFVGDPAGQTNQTLDNIEALISGKNLAKHGLPGFDAALGDLAAARVYVKKPEHYETIKAICDKRLADVPKVYTFADVCRDDLLVEVEGVASCKKL